MEIRATVILAPPVNLALVMHATDHSDVMWALWRFKSPPTRLFVQQLVDATRKKYIKSSHNLPFVKPPVSNGFPSERACNVEAVSHAVMTPSRQLCVVKISVK